MGKRITEEAKAAPEHDEHLHTKYRPRTLREVVGQKAIVSSLAAALDAKARPHCFLFTGPAGTGKTTLARIVAAELGVGPGGIIEVDAASKTGIDDMRELTAGLRYNGFGETPGKAIVVNECHRLSAQAWDSLLMTTEEPPPHAFFFFTSTNPDKIPKAMVTRCLTYQLANLKFDDIMDVLVEVCETERYDASDKILQLVARAANGSMRAALTGLAKVHACESADEAQQLLQYVDMDNAEIIDLARMLVQGKAKWEPLCTTLKSLDAQGVQAESIRLVIVNYLNACLLGSTSDKSTIRLLDMLACFMKPCGQSEKMAPILIAFGRFIFPD